MNASMSDQADNVIVFPGQEAPAVPRQRPDASCAPCQNGFTCSAAVCARSPHTQGGQHVSG